MRMPTHLQHQPKSHAEQGGDRRQTKQAKVGMVLRGCETKLDLGVNIRYFCEMTLRRKPGLASRKH